MKVLPSVIAEIHSEREVSEKFYENHNFPLDTDQNSGIWKLNSSADHLTRSKVLYHPTVITKKREEMRLSKVAEKNKLQKVYDDAVAVYKLNKDYEAEITKILQSNVVDEVDKDNITIPMASLELFDKLKVKHLPVFNRCRLQEDLMQKIKIPQKGNLQKVTKDEADKTTNGPFLIQLCMNVKSVQVVTDNPILPEVEVVVEEVAPPLVWNHLTGPESITIEPVTKE